MHQRSETPFGYILQWRLYLATVARSAITRRQARWSLDGREITYLGITLDIAKHIPQLIVCEYRRAYDLLHKTLLFGAAAEIGGTVEAHQVYDDLDAEDDNIRFMPPAVAELVLTFLAMVQPLRLVFLQETRPGKLLSPHLFSTLDGAVWPDEKLSRCLSQACARAEVPSFKVAWWRQVAASITKEKFTARERANFQLQDVDVDGLEGIEDEELMIDLAKASNHSYRTFNHAYAGSTTLAIDTVLHRAHRASESWRALFQ
ncbi:hypothetical protein S40285_09771, partial [Stachybotrys chlorohalonatus IBT 40285]